MMTIQDTSSIPVKVRQSSVGCYDPERLFSVTSMIGTIILDCSSNLHSASTLDVDKKVSNCATLLNDRKHIAKLLVSDNCH